MACARDQNADSLSRAERAAPWLEAELAHLQTADDFRALAREERFRGLLEGETVLPGDDPDIVEKAAALLWRCYALAGQREGSAALVEAIDLFAQLPPERVEAVPDTARQFIVEQPPPFAVEFLGPLAEERFECAMATRDAIALDAAVRLLSRLLERVDGGDARAWTLERLATALQLRCMRRRSVQDLDRAISLRRELAAGETDSPGERAATRSNLGTALVERARRLPGFEDLDQAIELFRLAIPDAIESERPKYLSNLCDALLTRGGEGDLEEAVAVGRSAVAASMPGDPAESKRLTHLGTALFSSFSRTSDPGRLEEAIRVFRDAVAETDAEDPARALRLSNLAKALGSAEDDAMAEHVNEACDVAQAAIEATPVGDAALPARLVILASALTSRHWLLGERADIDRAVALAERAVSALPSSDPESSVALAALGTALAGRYLGSGARAEADAAIESFRRAIAIDGERDREEPHLLARLAQVLLIGL
jgi:tetratricopeptide (TPR) repeat protein